MRRWVYSSALCGAIALGAGFRPGPAAARDLAPSNEFARIVERVAERFPDQHLTRAPLGDAISMRAWTNYLAALDFDRVYFLADDIRQFEAEKLNLDDQIRAGRVDFAFAVFDVFKQRLRERQDYVSSLLDKGFDLNERDSYAWKRKDGPWPADRAEWDDLWRKRIKNEYIRQILSRELAERKTDAGATNETATAELDVDAEEPEDNPLVSPEESIRKRYQQVMILIEDADGEWVIEKYLSTFAHAYDPHSDYMSPSSVDDFDIEMKLSLVGVGALLRAEDGMARVVRNIPGGPAERDGRLKPGDKIVAVAQSDEEPVDVLHWPLNKVVKLIRGEKGTRVVLTVIPASDPTGSTTRQVDLIRDEVKLEEQAASLKVLDLPDAGGVTRKLGLIKLPAFYANLKAQSVDDPEFRSSSYDMERKIEEMQREGVTGLLLDLRGNGGGSLMEAVNMVGLFISTGPAVQVRERMVRVLWDRDPRVVWTGPLVVLVNRLSASASEIVAGALQDYGRAVVLGDRRTHGKGTVQTILDLGRDERLGAIKVTTAEYYRISGSSTQLKGVSPDIVISSPFDFMDLGEESLPNPMAWSRVPSASYLPLADLAPVVADLRTQSEERRAADPRFDAYRRMLERIEAMNAEKDLPLDIDTRRTLARSEKDLADLQNSLAPESEETAGKEQDIRRDLVLLEGMRVLADLTARREREPERFEPPAATDKRSISEIISQWLRARP